MERTTLQQQIKELLMGNDNLLMQAVQDLNSWDGSFEDLQFYENNEEFFNMFFQENPIEAVRASYYGEYKYSDEYVRFNVYGNLESMDEYKVIEEMRDQVEEIAEACIDNQGNIYINEIDELIEEYENQEEEEEENKQE